MVPTTSCPKSLSYLTRCPANPTTFPRKPIPFPRAAVCFPLRAAQNLPLFHHLHLKPIHFPTICLTGSTPFPPPASQSDMCPPPIYAKTRSASVQALVCLSSINIINSQSQTFHGALPQICICICAKYFFHDN
jgi:hypothetical protein